MVEAKEGEKVALRAVYVDLQEKSKDTGLCDTDYVEIKDGNVFWYFCLYHYHYFLLRYYF